MAPLDIAVLAHVLSTSQVLHVHIFLRSTQVYSARYAATQLF